MLKAKKPLHYRWFSILWLQIVVERYSIKILKLFGCKNIFAEFSVKLKYAV